ncbi:MAG: EAL domain-containing protein [Xanthobacteraceae bacterium]|nr:EAL domain-containing protein [Xanthobacteraceae bacterium]
MIRISTIFIAICMVLIAASIGLILYSTTGLNVSESGLVALAALTFLILYNAVSMRLRDRTDVGTQIADLSRGTADLARQVAEFGRRMSLIETRLGATDAAAQDRVHAVMEEIGEIGGIIKNLATSVAAHDELLTSVSALAASHRVSPPLSMAPDLIGQAAAAPLQDSQPALRSQATETKSTANHAEVLVAVRNAIESNRIDLYLQPIVSLPQRKVRFYEAVSRLRDDNDRVIAASQFIETAETSGLIGRIDYMVLFRCVQVLRRLQVRSKDVGVFCNISGVTLGNPDVFGQCIEFLEANRALASSLVLEFKHASFRKLGPIESEHLGALRRLGFQFSIDNVTDLRIDGRELSDRGVRFIKVPGQFLLDQKQLSAADIHAADLSSLLGRFGIDLIAEKIEGERAVVDLLDYDVRFGQGFLFSAPRPLRPDGTGAQSTAEPPTDRAVAGRPQTSTLPAATDPRLTGTAALARRIAQS